MTHSALGLSSRRALMYVSSSRHLSSRQTHKHTCVRCTGFSSAARFMLIFSGKTLRIVLRVYRFALLVLQISCTCIQYSGSWDTHWCFLPSHRDTDLLFSLTETCNTHQTFHITTTLHFSSACKCVLKLHECVRSPLLTEEACQNIWGLQILRQLYGHGHHRELRGLNPYEASISLNTHTSTLQPNMYQ